MGPLTPPLLLPLLLVGFFGTALAEETTGQAERARAVRARLKALGYVASVAEDPDPDRTGVTQHDAKRAFGGVNVYCSSRSPKIHFLDMEGQSLQEIDLPAELIGGDCLVEPTRDGSLLALAQPNLWRIRSDGTVEAMSDRQHHHDVFVDPEGRVFTLSHREGEIEWRGARLPIRDHAVTVFAADGTVENEFVLSGLLAEFIPDDRKAKMAELARRGETEEWSYHWASDVFHANGIEILDRDVGVAPAGSALLSIRELDLIALVDLSAGEILWKWGPGELDGPHHPTLLDDGNILVFDNARARGRSRLLEVDPRTNEVVWEYSSEAPPFYTRHMGSVQPLPNGNRLVTESEKGRVFEIDRSGEVVWEFWNPDMVDETGKRRRIYRLVRLPDVSVSEPDSVPVSGSDGEPPAPRPEATSPASPPARGE